MSLASVVTPPFGGHVIMLEVDEDRKWFGSWKLLGKTESHRNERDPKVVQVWDCMVEGRLVRIVWYYLYQQDASSFR
jgi:hypothetical protein